MNILLIISLSISILYNLFVIHKFGIPESLSATSYLFNEYNNKHWLFSILCIVIVIGLFPNWIVLSTENLQFLVFLTCTGILFAGSTPFFKEDFQKPIHYTSGIIAFISYILWFVFNKLYFYLLSFFISFILLFNINPKNYVYYAEVIGYIILCLLILL